MFGHDDQSQHPGVTLPSPADATQTNDDQAMASAAMDNTAGEYIDSETAAAPIATPAAAQATTAPTTPAAATSVNADDLLDIKQQALQQLTPLVGHLEQSPEEKFRTTMMMIQAADNADLIKPAYEAAMQITDEKTRAQALLDIVNEINYFTHSNDNNQES